MDGEGHVIKTGLRDGVSEGELVYNAGEEYVVTARNYCRNHYNKENNKLKRNFFSITREISHDSSGSIVETLDGIMSLYSFSFYQEENKVHCRYLTCTCVECMRGNSGECSNEYLCGKEVIREFTKAERKKKQPAKPRKPRPAQISNKRGPGSINSPQPPRKRRRITMPITIRSHNVRNEYVNGHSNQNNPGQSHIHSNCNNNHNDRNSSY